MQTERLHRRGTLERSRMSCLLRLTGVDRPALATGSERALFELCLRGRALCALRASQTAQRCGMTWHSPAADLTQAAEPIGRRPAGPASAWPRRPGRVGRSVSSGRPVHRERGSRGLDLVGEAQDQAVCAPRSRWRRHGPGPDTDGRTASLAAGIPKTRLHRCERARGASSPAPTAPWGRRG